MPGGGTSSGFGGLPRASKYQDLRTRRGIQRLAGTQLVIGTGLALDSTGALTTTGATSNFYIDASVPGGNTIANTAALTEFTSAYAVSGKVLLAGAVLRLSCWGTYGTNGAPNITFAVVFDAPIGGITTMATSTAAAAVATAGTGQFRVDCLLACTVGTGGSSTFEVQGAASMAAGTFAAYPMLNAGTVSATVVNAFNVKVQAKWGAADPANTITLRQFMMERLA